MQNCLKIPSGVILGEEADPCPQAALFPLTVPPLSHTPLSLINNRWDPPFGIPGRSWRQNEAYFLPEIKQWAPQKGLCAQEPRVLFCFTLYIIKEKT